jgi:hypothetical protein
VLGTNTSGIGNTDLSWLVENTFAYFGSTSGSTNNLYGRNDVGYWTMSPVSSWPDSAWCVSMGGALGHEYIDEIEHPGIRPVITIPKSILE